MSAPSEELENTLNEIGPMLARVADGFVIIARVGNEDGKLDSYRYKTHGASSEQRGLLATMATYLDESDRVAWRESLERGE